MFLIRDRAVPFHPVIGIGALGSAAVNLKRRDRELGWEAGLVLEALDDAPSAADATWLRSVLEERMNEIYRVDFLEDELLHPGDIESPTQAAIDGLEAESNRCRDQHHASMLKKDYKTPPRDPNDPEYWRAQARTPLFRSKRAKELAGLLRIRSVLNRFLACDDPVEGVRRLLAEREGKRAIGDLVRRVKATRVGTQIADLMVCGALPPYSALAAGKLVAMLAVSPEVVCEYKRRYGCSPSVIASAMAGQALVRPADLVFVGTTSLYTERPCQYDRVSIPAGLIGGPTGLSVRYEYMAKTGGWGTFQFTAATTKAIVDHTRTEKNGLRVNYVFGEGANPKLRALREGLAALGFDEEILLKHGQKRLMYGVKLVANAPEVLLGRHQVPNYLFALDQPREATKAIVQWWAERWLQKRLARSDVLAKIKEHTLVHPIRHGARVVLPTADVEQGSLFD
jgi:hypothetical protein